MRSTFQIHWFRRKKNLLQFSVPFSKVDGNQPSSKKGLHIIVLPDKESAEYCCSDLYSFVDGDNVFFLPESGKNIERSNYKSSLAVQRTSALSRILSGEENLTIIVTYSSALSENILSGNTISSDRMIIREETKYHTIHYRKNSMKKGSKK